MNELTFSEKGFEEYLYWQTRNKKTLKKINSLLEDIKRNGVMQGLENRNLYVIDLVIPEELMIKID